MWKENHNNIKIEILVGFFLFQKTCMPDPPPLPPKGTTDFVIDLKKLNIEL